MTETSELVIPPPVRSGAWLGCPEDCQYRTRGWGKYYRHWKRKHR